MLELGVELGELLAEEQPEEGRRLPYDAAHKFAARHRAVARSLLEDGLDAPWVAGLDWERMELVSTEHLSRTLRRSVSDLVWRIGQRAPGAPDVHVLVEFQARDDWTMPLRMYNYAGQLLGGLVDTGAPGPALPPVQGVVVYHGERPWRSRLDLADLVAGAGGGAQPSWPVSLLETRRLRGAEGLPERSLYGALCRLQGCRDTREVRGELRALRGWLREADCPGIGVVVSVWVRELVLPRTPGARVPVIIEAERFLEEAEQSMTDWYERTKAEGIEQGIERGIEQGIERGIEQGREQGLEQGRERYLLYLVRERFGEAVQRSVGAALAAGAVRGSVEEVGKWLLTSPSAEAFLARVGAA